MHATIVPSPLSNLLLFSLPLPLFSGGFAGPPAPRSPYFPGAGEDPAAHGHWCAFTDLYHTIPYHTIPWVCYRRRNQWLRRALALFCLPLIWLARVVYLTYVEATPYPHKRDSFWVFLMAQHRIPLHTKHMVKRVLRGWCLCQEDKI